jgi:RNA polymerase sigma-70 factor (ECF subfamily)
VCLDTFQRVLTSRAELRVSFRAFLFTVAHRLCLDRMRAGTRTRRALERLPDAERPHSPEERAVHADRVARLEEAMESLPEAHRAVLLLYYGQELKSREVAEILGWRHDQARSKIAYACRLLRDALALSEDVPA